MGSTLVHQALMGTYRLFFGSEYPGGSFSLAQDLETAEKILLVPEDGLEKLILTRSFLRGLRRRYPSASISVVTPGEFSSVLEGNYWSNHLFFYDRRSRNPFSKSLRDLVEQLKPECFDLAIDLSYRHNLGTYLPISLSGASITVGFYDPANVFTYSIAVRAPNDDRPFLPKMWSLFNVLDIHPEGDIYRLPGEEAVVETVWKTVGFSLQPNKDRLLGVFLDETVEGVIGKREELVRLLKFLNTLPSKKILLAQNRISRSVWEDLPRYDVLVLPRETIAKVASILKECHYILTNSVGFALLMASVGGKVVVLVPQKDFSILSLDKIHGIKPFLTRGKELPLNDLGLFLKTVMISE